jgi:predicted transcriptional regulator
MMTSRRVWPALLVTALATTLAFSSVQGADPKLLPKDTEIIFSVNLKQILDSELVKTYQKTVEQGKKELETQIGDNPILKYLKSAGFDVFRDLHSITVAGNGGKEPTSIIIEGTFNKEKLASTVEDIAKDNPEAIKISKNGDQRVYEITAPGEKTAFATLIDGKVLFATLSKEGLKEGLARLAGTQKSSLKKEFSVLLETVNKQQSLSFVATGAALSKMMEGAPVPNGEAAVTALQNIDGLSGALTVGKEVGFQLGINAKDEAGAKKMAQDGTGALLGIQFLINQQAKKDEKFAPVVDIVKTLRIANKGSNVILTGTVSMDVIEKLMKNIPQ